MKRDTPADLVERAKAIELGNRRSKTHDEAEMNLALAWAKGEVRGQQVMRVLQMDARGRGSLYNFLATRLREALRSGILVETNHR